MSNAPEYDGYLKADPYARKTSIPGSSPHSRGSVSRQVNKVRQVNMLPSQKASSLERAISKIDLSHLSEEERAKVLNVVQRDLQVRVVEKERLKRYRTSLLRRDREVAAKSQALAESYNCLLCGQKFILLINPRMQCKNCGRQICRRCSETVTEVNGPLCRLCLRETGYRAMRCNWFYDTVISRFREFGSTAVAKSIFGDKYQHIQNIAEDELANIISMYGSNENDGDVIVNEQKVPSQSLEQAKDVQLKRLRTKLETLMQNTMKEYQLVDQDRNLTDQQKYWQGGRISVEFRKAAATQLRSFTQTFYITTERQRSSQGNSSRNVTQYVMNTLQQEVSRIVGHPIKDVEDNLSLASDDDLESVAYAEREGIEERLAQALLDKVLRDRQYYASGVKKEVSRNAVSSSKPAPDIKITEDNGPSEGRLASKETPSRSSTPSSIDSTGKSDEKPYLKCEQITVEEGTPTRLEVKVDFNENCEFSWLKENDSGRRTQVICDFHCEHVITGTSDPEGQDYFVLSNSGHFGAEATERLLKTHKLLKDKRAPYGVVVQHQLIFWAAKLEDTGKYFAVARTPAGSGTFAVTEAQYLLTVQPASKWPIYPKHSPDFIQPLAIVPPTEAQKIRCLELMCTVASNPAPRCLFYRNNTPIPVVIMPLLTNEDDKQDLCLSSFSHKFTVVSSPDRDAKAPMSIGYLRKLLLRINSPMAEDAATYTCRAWNVHGRVETSTNVSSSDIRKGTSLWLNGSLPRGSLSQKIEQTQNGVLNSAKEIQKTAQTHGDILGQYGRTSSGERISPLRSQPPTEEEVSQ
ncbi:Rab effector MyRIP [Clonorchis sinensis]|uniref:Rab effector MyRIP n=1 Tax=Clonorchis sinensis TaxID=79923 RepID=G7YCB4_CLOSI|nr:Rab effector MyRIP [Clonorchis sinensis]